MRVLIDIDHDGLEPGAGQRQRQRECDANCYRSEQVQRWLTSTEALTRQRGAGLASAAPVRYSERGDRMTASLKEIIEANSEEIHRHLTAIADILGSAGAGDPVNHIVLKFPEHRNFFVTWNRNNDPLTEEDRENIRKAEAAQESFETDAALPGPYKMDPLSGMSMRIDSEQSPYVVITDIFGGHQAQILRSEWEEWEDAPSTV